MENFNALEVGDVIRNTGSGNEYEITEAYRKDGSIMAKILVRHDEIGPAQFCNPSEWEFVGKRAGLVELNKVPEPETVCEETKKEFEVHATKQFLYEQGSSLAAVAINIETTKNSFSGTFAVTNCGGKAVEIHVSTYTGEKEDSAELIALKAIRSKLNEFINRYDMVKKGRQERD